MRAVVIHNPTSGVIEDHSPLNAALAALRDLGWEIRTCETQAPGAATALAQQAAAAGVDAVFAVGGDGTLNEVLNGLLDTQTAVGVLPLGTANVWALEMGLPLNDLKQAALLQAQGSICQIDVGIAHGKTEGPRAFLLSCGAGFDASVIREVETQRALKRQWGKLFFVLVGIRQALAFRGRSIQVTVDGKTYKRRVILALTSNTQLYAGFARVPPDALIDDGLLDVTLLHGENVFHTAWLFFRLGTGLSQRQPDIEHLRGCTVSIRGATLPLHIDAEPFGTTPVTIQIKPRALRVLVPATARRELFQQELSDERIKTARPGPSL